jgi:hypothetical protein
MKANPNIDELLCSFIDGELPLRQQTEIQRLMAKDPEVARRLRQLQNTRALVGALPRAEAPAEMLDQIKFTLERRSLLDERPAAAGVSAGRRHLIARKLVAAAAMIALLGVLGAVVYQILAPVPSSGPRIVAIGGDDGAASARMAAGVSAADAGFAGRLEIRTAAVTATDASIKRGIEALGFSAALEQDAGSQGRVYRLVGTRESVGRLVASLGEVWQELDDATLHVGRPDNVVGAVVVDDVTADQTIRILAQETTEASLRTARYCAVENSMPGREIVTAINRDVESALAMAHTPKPWITKTQTARDKLVPSEDDAQASLTIILRGTQ